MRRGLVFVVLPSECAAQQVVAADALKRAAEFWRYVAGVARHSDGMVA